MNLERHKENFKNHIAKFTDYGNIKILDFKNPNSSDYRIRFLFEEDYCRLHISGDLGELIATNYNNMVFGKFKDFVNDVGYFEQKIDCHNRAIYMYDEDLAREQLKNRIEEYGWIYDIKEPFMCLGSDDDIIEDFLNEVFERFSDSNGIDSNAYDELSKLDSDAYEWAYELGKKETGILELYMLAFKLAMEQIENQNVS